MDEIRTVLQDGDAPEVLRAWINGPIQAERRGEFCACPEPDITGRKSYLCFRCGRYNLERKTAIERAMNAPHPFEPMGGDPISSQFCGFCAFGVDDPRHS